MATETTDAKTTTTLDPTRRFVDVRDPHDGSLLFRYDPARQLVEIRKRGVTRLVDLSSLCPVDNQ